MNIYRKGTVVKIKKGDSKTGLGLIEGSSFYDGKYLVATEDTVGRWRCILCTPRDVGFVDSSSYTSLKDSYMKFFGFDYDLL